MPTPLYFEADDGGFLSIPLKMEASAELLNVEHSPEFKLLSTPPKRFNKILINFYINRGAKSKKYQVIFNLRSSNGHVKSVVCTVFVRPRIEFAVEAPPGREVLIGGRAQYWVSVINSGNVDDVIEVELRIPDRDAAVEPTRLALPVGGRSGFLLKLQPRNPQPIVALLELRSHRDPKKIKYISIKTNVLPFAGAGRLGKRALRYQIIAKGGPSDDGWDYDFGARLGGEFSDYIYGVLDAEYAPRNPRIGLGLSGEWGRLGLSFSKTGYETRLSIGSWEGSMRYAANIWSGSLAWRPGRWRVSIGGSEKYQRFSVGSSFLLGQWWLLEPSVFLNRYQSGDASLWNAGGQVYLKLDSPSWLLSARLSYLEGRYTANGEISRRRNNNYSIHGYWYYNNKKLKLKIDAEEALNNIYFTNQNLFIYQGNIGWRLGLRYAESGVPWRFGLGLSGINTMPGGYTNFSYREASWGLGGRLGWRQEEGVGYTLNSTFYQPGSQLTFSLTGGAKNMLGVKLRHIWGSWEISGNYNFLLNTEIGSGSAELIYNVGNWALKSGIKGDAYAFKWWLAGSLRLEGGFQTPEEVVQVFGGRKTGRAWGIVFIDQNQNGILDKDEKKIAGAIVGCGTTKAVSSATGEYSFEGYPGECQLSVQDPKNYYGLPVETSLELTANANLHYDLALVPVAGISGYVWLDENKNGVRDKGERSLPGVEVLLSSPSGVSASTWSDARGRFAISYLSPGRYKININSSGLTRLQQPSEALEIDLRPGPPPFVGLAVLPKELRQVQTFTQNDVAIYVDLARQTAPPGADLPLRVTVSGMEADSVFVEAAGRRESLIITKNNFYKGYLHIPENAKGAFFYRVVAKGSNGEVEQKAMLIVRRGSLARLLVEPAYVDPGAEVRITASLLKLVDVVEIFYNGKVYPMQRQDDLTWTLHIEAPDEPGRYPLELWVEGKKWAEAAFRVAE